MNSSRPESRLAAVNREDFFSLADTWHSEQPEGPATEDRLNFLSDLFSAVGELRRRLPEQFGPAVYAKVSEGAIYKTLLRYVSLEGDTAPGSDSLALGAVNDAAGYLRIQMDEWAAASYGEDFIESVRAEREANKRRFESVPNSSILGTGLLLAEMLRQDT